jgi:hypothetical protein
MKHLLRLTLVALLLAPPAAHAATVQYDAATQAFSVIGASDADRLRIVLSATALDVSDLSQPVTSSAPDCAVVGPRHLRCFAADGGGRALTVDAGDGDDLVDVDSVVGVARLAGGAGADLLSVTLATAQDGSVLDGGADRDLVALVGTFDGPVTVDLAAKRITTPRGTTALLDVESASSERASGATLLGDDGPNGLTAGPGSWADGRGGDDYLLATSGPSTLVGGEGDDFLDTDPGGHRYTPGHHVTVDAGPGNDRLRVYGAISVTCGPGFDVVLEAPPLVPADCEGADQDVDPRIDALASVTRRALRVPLTIRRTTATCGVSAVVVTRSGRPVSVAARTRRVGDVDLTFRRTRLRPLPHVLWLRVSFVSSCPSDGRWRGAVGVQRLRLR